MLAMILLCAATMITAGRPNPSGYWSWSALVLALLALLATVMRWNPI